MTMIDKLSIAPIRANSPSQTRGLREQDFATVDRYVREALIENKRSGLLLAVRARWVALTITAFLIPFINPSWQEILYYEIALLGFAFIGWAQLRAGRVAQSRIELLIIFCDLALLTFIMVVPNPVRQENWPTAFQFELSEFSYFYILLAAATLGYSWRTLYAFGTWTAVLWALAVVWITFFTADIPELTEKTATAFADYERIKMNSDPNDPKISFRIQEIVIFLIVAGILTINGQRNNRLLFRQAEAARERSNLARHFPPNIVDQMARQDQPLGDVRSQEVAVMFVDIVGFTHIAEQQTPQDVVALLREFHSRLEASVFEHQGTLDKFLGDGIMATFGTPATGPHDASNALRCACAMLAAISAWNETRAEPINISIGVHYGPVVLGDIGSARRLEYAVLGDTVNVASRLESLTRNLGVRLVMSDSLVAAARNEKDNDVATLLASLEHIGPQQVRGRDESISVWTLSSVDSLS